MEDGKVRDLLRSLEASELRFASLVADLRAVVEYGEAMQELNREALDGRDFAGMLHNVPTVKDFRTVLDKHAGEQPAMNCKLCGKPIQVMAFRRDGFCSVLHKREYEAQHSEE